MSSVFPRAALAFSLSAAACAAAPPFHVEDPGGPSAGPAAAAHPLAADEAALADHPTLAAVLRVALARNPELDAARARADAAAERVPAAGRLPAPQAAAQVWGAPLLRPWAWDDAGAIMIGVRQTLPAPGVRGAASRAAEEDARAAAAEVRAVELDVTRRVEEAWGAYALAERSLAIHGDQIATAGQLIDVTGQLLATGHATQADVLRLDLERSRLHQDIARLERDRRVAAVRLNALMGRAPSDELGPPLADDAAPPELPTLATVEALALAHRPELAAADHRVRARKADADGRRKAARWPSLMLGADYMLMPSAPDVRAYSLMVTVDLPWFGSAGAEAHAADADTRAEERQVVALRNEILAEVGEAWAAVDAARDEAKIVDEELLPRAQRAFEGARAAYSTGAGSTLAVLDALDALLDIRMEQARTHVELSIAWAALERAAGTPLAPGVHQ